MGKCLWVIRGQSERSTSSAHFFHVKSSCGSGPELSCSPYMPRQPTCSQLVCVAHDAPPSRDRDAAAIITIKGVGRPFGHPSCPARRLAGRPRPVGGQRQTRLVSRSLNETGEFWPDLIAAAALSPLKIELPSFVPSMGMTALRRFVGPATGSVCVCVEPDRSSPSAGLSKQPLG